MDRRLAAILVTDVVGYLIAEQTYRSNYAEADAAREKGKLNRGGSRLIEQ